MILNTNLLSSIKSDTIPQDGDSNFTVPAMLMPSAELSIPLQSIFVSTVAGPWSASQVMTTSALFGLAFFQINAAQSSSLCGAIGPGLWELDLQCCCQVQAAAAGASYMFFITFGFSSGLATETGNLALGFLSSVIPSLVIERKIKIAQNRDVAYLGLTLPAVGVGIQANAYGSIIARRLG